MAPSPKRPPRSRHHDRRIHSRNISSDDLLPPDRSRDEPPRRKPKSRPHAPSSAVATSNVLSADSLAQLNALNEKAGVPPEEKAQPLPRETDERRENRHRERDPGREGVRERERDRDLDRDRDRNKDRERHERREERRRERREQRRRETDQEHGRRRDEDDHNHYREKSNYREKKRVISGPLLEEGGNRAHHDDRPRMRGGGRNSDPDSENRARRKKKRKKWIIGIIVAIIVLIIIIGVAVSVSNKNKSPTSDPDSSLNDGSSTPANNNLKHIPHGSIPASAQGTYYDPFDWYDTVDFNVTYTTETVGGLPIMGLNSTWDNNVQANPSVPALTQSWSYGTQKIHGINFGGWLSLEPFITPSLFDAFGSGYGVIDEWTLSAQLGTKAASTLEQHYSSFITKQDFADIKAAGFDHIRIPFSYWAVTTYEGDPYVPMISWRYLLRAIEYARLNGIRINLDLHGAPGSQNGWNHSGRQGPIGWLNGTDGTLNAQRTIDIHKQLGAFFAQPRYKNLVTMYGLVNEPRMTALSTESVVAWSQEAISELRTAGLGEDVIIVIGDGFLGLANWKGSSLSGSSNVLLDAHQYVIFNTEQIILSHTDKIEFACNGWTQQSEESMSTTTGFGSFLCGEWSQADTDCQTFLNDVGVGNRWEGTMNVDNSTLDVLIPTCPLSPKGQGSQCSCTGALADPSSYSTAYKQWLIMFAEAQMKSYEVGWGWFYWTWKTETATQWSYQSGMQAGILPTDVRTRGFDCSQAIPDFQTEGLSEGY